MIRKYERRMIKIIKNQYEHEHKAWLRSVEFFMQENALLKYRLSDMVDDNDQNNFLQMAEHFQNELLLKDKMLKTLAHDLKAHSDIISEMQDEKKAPLNIIKDHDRFRDKMLQFEKGFLQLSKEFNEQMLEGI